VEGSTAFAAIFQRVHPPTTFEETVERLGTAIKLGLLVPGSRLPPERELAAQLGIARSTLRQALRALVQSGHLHAVRGRAGGTFVSDAPPLHGTDLGHLPPDWRGVLDYRIAVEMGAAALAAERATPRSLDRMATLVDQMTAAPHFDAYRRADVGFHIGLAEAAASPRLIAAMTDVQSDMSDLIFRIAHPEEVLARSNDQHRRIVAALARGDGARAVRMIRQHLDGTEHILVGLLPPAPRDG
jgi:DNA-binding FadR family transcriptional regulator